jgi:urease accessory protein
MAVIKVTERLEQAEPAQATLTLPFELRQKSRLRATLDNGEEVGLMLERGHILRGGDCLRAENGTVIQLRAAPEPVSTATSADGLLLQRACYHLGNRHVPLQIMPGGIRYMQDHVLDAMAQALGLHIKHENAPFEPEAGAYHSHSHHAHDH